MTTSPSHEVSLKELDRKLQMLKIENEDLRVNLQINKESL